MPALVVDLVIPRPRAEVLAWWTQLPDDYRATDPREEPHRILVKRRAADSLEVLTFWRGPFGRDIVIPQTFRFRPDGDFDIEMRLPFGLAQVDRFRFTERDGSTHAHIEVEVWARHPLGRLARRPFLALYARRSYPRTWRDAAELCARDAPRLHDPGASSPAR